MFQYVPLSLLGCPAFQACVQAMGAQLAAMSAPHGRYSFLMNWGA